MLVNRFLRVSDLSQKNVRPILSLINQNLAEIGTAAEDAEQCRQKSSRDFVYGFGFTILNKPKKMILSQRR